MVGRPAAEPQRWAEKITDYVVLAPASFLIFGMVNGPRPRGVVPKSTFSRGEGGGKQKKKGKRKKSSTSTSGREGVDELLGGGGGVQIGWSKKPSFGIMQPGANCSPTVYRPDEGLLSANANHGFPTGTEPTQDGRDVRRTLPMARGESQVAPSTQRRCCM